MLCPIPLYHMFPYFQLLFSDRNFSRHARCLKTSYASIMSPPAEIKNHRQTNHNKFSAKLGDFLKSAACLRSFHSFITVIMRLFL